MVDHDPSGVLQRAKVLFAIGGLEALNYDIATENTPLIVGYLVRPIA